MGYITESDLTSYGVTDPNAYQLIERASRIIDNYMRWPRNADGFKFPRLRISFWDQTGDYYGAATLSSSITDSDVNLTLTGTRTGYGTGLWQLGDYRGEIVKVTAYNSTSGAATMTRGYSGTTPQAWPAGTPVSYSIVPTEVKNATIEQIIWMLQQGDEYSVQGGDASQVETPLLAPLARLFLRGFDHRVGWSSL